MGAMMGLLGGLGKGLSAAANNMQAFNMEEAKARIQAERDKCIEEAAIAREGREQGYKIAAEGRDIENDKIRAQNKIDLETNPDTVNKYAQAGVSRQQVEDEYKDSRLDADVNRAKLMADATRGPDHYNYAGASLDNQMKQRQLDLMGSEGYLSDNDKEYIKQLQTAEKDYSKQSLEYLKLSQREEDPAKKASYEAQAERMRINANKASQAIQSRMGGNTSGPSRESLEALVGGPTDKEKELGKKMNVIANLSGDENVFGAGWDENKINETYEKLIAKESGKTVEQDKPKEPGMVNNAIKKASDVASDLFKDDRNPDALNKARSILLNGPKALGNSGDPEIESGLRKQRQNVNYILNSDMSEEQKLDAIYRMLVST